MELIKVFRKRFDRVVFSDIIFFELLDNNQYEQIEHNVGNHHYEADVVYWGIRRPARLAFLAVWGRVNTIVHESVPVFPCSDGEQKEVSSAEIPEVLKIRVDYLRLLSQPSKEEYSQYCKHEQN